MWKDGKPQAKWYKCTNCRRVFKDSQRNLRKHLGCPRGSIKVAGDEPFWHAFYQPELLWDWLKLKLEDCWNKIPSK